MITLKELVAWQELTNQDDIGIIKTWFIENNAESIGLTIIPELAKNQVDKVQNILDYSRSWLPYLPDLEKSNKGLTHDQAHNIQAIITMYVLGMDLKESNYYDWAKNEIPKIPLPKIIFVPCKEWLEKEYGIKFKEQQNERV